MGREGRNNRESCRKRRDNRRKGRGREERRGSPTEISGYATARGKTFYTNKEPLYFKLMHVKFLRSSGREINIFKFGVERREAKNLIGNWPYLENG